MAIIKPNNNTISAITALPAAIPTGSLVKLAAGTTSFSSTPNLSTIIALTLDEISDIILLFKVPTKIKNFTLYPFFFIKIKKKSPFKC